MNGQSIKGKRALRIGALNVELSKRTHHQPNEMSRRLKSLLVAALVFLTMMYASTCKGQEAKHQFWIEKVCEKDSCRTVRGIIAITDSCIYVRVNKERIDLEYKTTFTHKGSEYFDIKGHYFNGWLILMDKVIYVDLHFGSGHLTEFYHLKPQ